MSKKTNKNEVRKLIDLPMKTVKKFDKLADKNRTKTKPLMEKILIDYKEINSPTQ